MAKHNDLKMKAIKDWVDVRLYEDIVDDWDPDNPTWQDHIREYVQHEMDEDSWRKNYADDIVKQRSSEALRKGNKIIREQFNTNELELGWWNNLNYPVAIHWEVPDGKGGTKVEHKRIAIYALTPDDLLRFAQIEDDRATKQYKASMGTVDSARESAQKMIESGYTRYGDWAKYQFGGK